MPPSDPNQTPRACSSSRTPAPGLRELFTPTFIGISLINFLGMAAYYAAFVVSTSFLTTAYQTSTGTAGLATGLVVIGCLVGRFFSGRLVEVLGYKRLLIAGVLLYMATNLLYLIDGGLALFFAVRFFSGVGVGVVGTVTGSLVAVITPAALLGRGIAYFSMSTALSLCFGPFIGIAFLEMLGYQGIFSICAGISVVSVAIALSLKVNRAPKKSRPHPLALSDFIDVKLVPFCLLIALLCLPWGCAQAFLASYGKESGYTAAASVFFLCYAAAILISRPFSGKVYDMHGPALIFYPAIVLLAAGLALLWASWGEWSVLAAGALMGLGFGNIQSVGQASAVSMVRRERYTQATSTFYIFFDLGIGLAPYVFGQVAGAISFAEIFGINALIVLAGIPLYWLLNRRKGEKPSAGEAIDL